ncbi:MAG: efflux RND transporter periplasmic adaptor subunit, partial [Patescibacteria group bacterium]
DAQTFAVASAKTAKTPALTAAQTAVNNAAKSLDTARLDAQSAGQELAFKTAPLREVDKNVYRAAIASAEAEAELARQRLAEASLAAPKAGIVGSIDINVGEMATPSVRAVSLISATYQVEAKISELDIGKMAAGMPVSVTFDALGAAPYAGKISEIGAREVRQDEDIFYEITVSLDGSSAPLRPGMTAELTIPIGAKNDALLVPKRLLIKRAGRTSVRIYRNGSVEEKDVRVGLEGDEDVEIVDGLIEGDHVVDRIE